MRIVTCCKLIVSFLLLHLPAMAFAQAPSFSINDVTVEEANWGGSNATFTVKLSGILSPLQTYAVAYSTMPGTATGGGTCGGDTDFIQSYRILSFQYPMTTQTFTISVCPDTRAEPNETFTVNLSSASGAIIADGQGQATIIDNDTPIIRIGNVSQNEGNSGQTNFAFPATLSNPSTQQVTTTYAVYAASGDTATSGSSCNGTTDVVGGTGTVTFSPGVTSQTINVPVCGDTTSEASETFRIMMAQATNAEMLNDGGRGTIVNDDAGLPVLSIGDVSIVEDRPTNAYLAATFTLSLSSSNHAGCSIYYTCVGRNATPARSVCSGGDYYSGGSGLIIFRAGETSKSIFITICKDTVPEANETFEIRLSGATGLDAPDLIAVGTILDND